MSGPVLADRSRHEDSVKRPPYDDALLYAAMLWATEGTTLDKLELGIFAAAMIALIVCGCIFTRKPKAPKPPHVG
jgi:hypothetical protein